VFLSVVVFGEVKFYIDHFQTRARECDSGVYQ
jgi:hypothetical protein